SVVNIGQAEARTFTAAVVHEDLERGYPEVPRIARYASKLCLCRNDEVVAEVDAGAGLSDSLHFIEQRFKRIGCHEIGDEGSNAAHRCRSGFALGILWDARSRYILA